MQLIFNFSLTTFFFFWEWASCISGWPWTRFVVKNNPELWIFLSLSPEGSESFRVLGKLARCNVDPEGHCRVCARLMEQQAGRHGQLLTGSWLSQLVDRGPIHWVTECTRQGGVQGDMETLVTHMWPRTCTIHSEKSWGFWAIETGGYRSDISFLLGQKSSNAWPSGGTGKVDNTV